MLGKTSVMGGKDTMLWVLLCFKLDQDLSQGKSLSGIPVALYDASFLEETPTQSRCTLSLSAACLCSP